MSSMNSKMKVRSVEERLISGAKTKCYLILKVKINFLPLRIDIACNMFFENLNTWESNASLVARPKSRSVDSTLRIGSFGTVVSQTNPSESNKPPDDGSV